VVFFEVGGGFVGVELETQRGEVHALVAGANLTRAEAASACARCPHLRIEIWGTRLECQSGGASGFTSHPSQKREGWGTRAFGVAQGWATRRVFRRYDWLNFAVADLMLSA
jgi:hypothetical protein